MSYSVKIIHNYNTVIINLTDDIGKELEVLTEKLHKIQLEQECVFTEVQLTRYAGRKLESNELAKLLDLIRMYCKEFEASSVYIFAEEIQCKGIVDIFKSNPNYIKSNSLIKLITKDGTPIILRED